MQTRPDAISAGLIIRLQRLRHVNSTEVDFDRLRQPVLDAIIGGEATRVQIQKKGLVARVHRIVVNRISVIGDSSADDTEPARYNDTPN